MRIRPPNGSERVKDRTLKKVLPDMVTVGDRKFTFDSVFDSKANQVLASIFVCFREFGFHFIV